MNLKEKIKWYEEILRLDPSSKFYFQLAKLYVEEKLFDKAISILNSGLEKHPEDLEARFLLNDLLIKKDDLSESFKQIEVLDSILRRYPSFWRSWSKHLRDKGDNSIAVAVAFLGVAFEKKEISWEMLLTLGLNAITGDIAYVQKEMDQEEKVILESEKKENLKEDIEEEKKEEYSFKTKTMAEILESQGDLKGAINIYNELLEKASDEEKEDLLLKIKNLEKKLSVSEDDFGKKKRMINIMEGLVLRLQKRIGLGYEV